MTERDAALGILLGDCLYEDFVMVLHLAGLGTRMDTVNECCVFNIERPNEFEGRYDFEYKYLGNFKVQGDIIILFPPGYPQDSNTVRLEDLNDPELYQKVLGYFGKERWEIELFLEHRQSHQDFLAKAKL